MADEKSTRLSLDHSHYVSVIDHVESQTTSNFIVGAKLALQSRIGVNSRFMGCIHSLYIDDLPLSVYTGTHQEITTTAVNVAQGCLSTAVCASRPCHGSAKCVDEWELYR